MRKSQRGGHEEDGGVVRTIHGQHGPANIHEEVLDDKGQGWMDSLRYAVEVDSTS